MSQPYVNRRGFLQAGGTLALGASSYANVLGSNARIGVGMIGCGGRAQAHLHMVAKLAEANAGVCPLAVCDVWDGLEDHYQLTVNGQTSTRRYSQGLYPAAKICGLDPANPARVTKDYRRLLDLKDVDAVCIATPDHWHARQTLDAFAAGKDVLVEKPMTRTAAEATAVEAAAHATGRILAVGVQTLTDSTASRVFASIQQGAIGAVSHISGGVFRNDPRGQWRYYRVPQQLTPRTVDWPLWLGTGFSVNGVALAGETPPFDPTLFAQWRCSSAFSGGPISDMLCNTLSRLLAATGLRTPARVLASGGTYVEQDGRTVPDVATLIAEYPPIAQLLLTTSTASAYPAEELIRGRAGTIKLVQGGYRIIADGAGAKLPPRLNDELPVGVFHDCPAPKNETEALWLNFLECVRTRNANTTCGPALGAAVSTILANASAAI